MIGISKWSGKCDVYDSLIEIHNYTEEELKNNIKIYVGSSQESLKISSQKDLIPYYPYLIGSACYSNAERKSVIHLTSESFVDSEERECLEWRLQELIRIYNRCKRKKIEFDVEDAVNKITWNGWNEEPHRELANRVKEKGKKTTIDGIHLKMHEHRRQLLVEEMIKNGLNPTDYGYGRFVKEE